MVASGGMLPRIGGVDHRLDSASKRQRRKCGRLEIRPYSSDFRGASLAGKSLIWLGVAIRELDNADPAKAPAT